jgi:hypothetical protein
VQPDDRPPHLISPDEVSDWLAGSYVLAVTYHRTHRSAAAIIRSQGVDPTRSPGGSFGAGFYTATVEEEEYGPTTLAVAVRLQNPLVGPFADVEQTIDRIAGRLNPPRGEITPEVAQEIRVELLDLGYDGIVVLDGGGDGIDWVIALLGESVKVVEE